jgi:hypothetical protein
LAGAASAYDVALSRVLAALMARDLYVRVFRERRLRDKLLAWDKDETSKDETSVEEWMDQYKPPADTGVLPPRPVLFFASNEVQQEARAAMQQQGALNASVPVLVPARYLVGEYVFSPPLQQQITIAFDVPDDAIPRQQIVQPGTPVEDLRAVVDRLLKRVPWTEAQATVFVLTGRTPLIPPLRGALKRYGRLATLPRITLEVDPRMTQRELAAEYQRLRAQVLASDIRHQDLSAKHLVLAVWSTLQEESEGKLAERMARWNAAHPDWAYRHTFTFSRDMKRAIRRLLHDPDLMLYPELRDADVGEE